MYVIPLPVWPYFVVFQNSLGSEPCVLYEISVPLNDEFHSTYVMHKIINRQTQGRLNEQGHAECSARQVFRVTDHHSLSYCIKLLYQSIYR